MTYLNTILNAADRAAAIEANFEIIDTLLKQLLGGSAAGTSYRFKDGQLQFWDPAAAAADATKPWRAPVLNDSQLGWSDPISD